MLQVACLCALWALKSSPIGILFPVLIAGLHWPVRTCIADRMIDEESLVKLDPADGL